MFCPTMKETAEHFLAECPAYSLKRIQTFGIAATTIDYLVRNFDPKTIVKFANSTGRLEDTYTCYYVE